jgi:DNA-binding LytR/AlgR family response regulator
MTSKVLNLISDDESLQKILDFLQENDLKVTFSIQNQVKDRLIAKKGTNFLVVQTADVAYFYTESKVVFLIDKNGDKFIVENTLSELENLLAKQQFFRVNRKFIVNITAIKSFKPSFKGKIALELIHLAKAEVSISQENATEFKNWVEQV